MENKLNPLKLKGGDKLSRISYVTVIDTDYNSVQVKNEEGLIWDITKDIVAKECYSANQFNEEREVSRTELIEIFNNVGNAVFTVNFDKLPTAEDFLKLTRGEEGVIRSFKDMEKDFKKLKGENRTLVGYLVKPENGFGRSLVIDLEADTTKESKAPKFRQVDHRSLNWLICKNTKYIVK